MEIWKDIPNYKGLYQVSNFGNVKSLSRKIFNGKGYYLKKEIILTNNLDNKGYPNVTLYSNSKRTTFKNHTIVALVFFNFKYDKNIDLVIDHKNNIKTDNRVENLQIITNRKNCSKDKDKSKTSSKYIGVCWDKRVKKWSSEIRIEGNKNKIGYFDDEYQAHLAYQKELNKL